MPNYQALRKTILETRDERVRLIDYTRSSGLAREEIKKLIRELEEGIRVQGWDIQAEWKEPNDNNAYTPTTVTFYAQKLY